jgi:signal transduction histidine kinase/CheY-like chemotaxis protein
MGQVLSERELATKVRREQITSLYRQLPTSIGGTLIGMLVLAAAMWRVSPHVPLLGWCVLVIANQGWRALLHARFFRADVADAKIDRWALYWATGAGISGLLWGSTAFLFLSSTEPHYQVVLTVLVFGVTTGAVPLIASDRWSFYAFVVPALLPYVLRNAFEDDVSSGLLMVIEFVVMLAIISFGRNYNRLLARSLQDRFQNEALAERLQQQNLELAVAREAAEAASRSKTQFFAAASHDLRQPLHALGLFASALNDRVHDPGVTRLVASVKASVSALDSLFNELLDISKIDAGVIEPNLEFFRASSVLDRLRSDFEPEASEKGLRLSVRPCTAYLHGDPVLLERILRNLLSNALRYTERGGVLLGCRRRGERMVFEVWDSGTGIPGDQQRRVFEEFYQIGNPERSNKRGLGLGLSIVKRLSDLLGYKIELASRPGRGTVFRFSIPLGMPPEPAACARPAEPLRGNIAGGVIVVIDDDASIVDGMTWLLSDWGAEVIASASGTDVIEKVYAAGRLPDMIIADYRLAGGRTGAHVIDELRRELDPEIPAILLTGSTTPECVEEASRFGCSLLLKPADPDMLRALIASKLREGSGIRAGWPPAD